MKKINISLLLILVATLSLTMLFSCGKNNSSDIKTSQADSLINEAYKNHDYDSLITLSNQLQESGSLSEIKASYWRGYAYSRQRRMRLAESNWQKAIAQDIHTDEDMEYYSKSANRLAGSLLLKGEFEATMRVAVPAMEKMQKAELDQSSDYAYLLVTVGCCQLRLENPSEAAMNFEKAYQLYGKMIQQEPTVGQFTSAIVGVITITDNYLLQKRFPEAFYWTSHFDELLKQYEALPDAEQAFLDKQQARLNFYRASTLEGLGQHAEAEKAYAEACKTDYGMTNEGQLEAATYLMSAHRWSEAAHNYEVLDEQIKKYGASLTLDIIQNYLLAKYRANVGAQNLDSAINIGMQICDVLDTAIVNMQRNDAIELATLYSMQQKENEIMQQKNDMARQRLVATTVALMLIILFFVLIIYFRHKAAMRLEAAYSQLEIANERTKESSRMKTSFIRQISHEIRTPLNILSGFVQIITTPDIKLGKEEKEDINQKIIENTTRITELVNKMLELSDASSKTVIERNDKVKPVQIAVEAMNVFPQDDQSLIPIDLQVAEDMDDVILTTNEQAATRALVLLLDNAEKYTKAGYIRLTVEKCTKYNSIHFIVEDTGIGIPIKEREHIFEEFVQLDENKEGTGIGLTVARSLCNRLGGSLILDTLYTKGARFIMSLPYRPLK